MQRMAFVHKPEDPQEPDGVRDAGLCCAATRVAISESKA